MYIKKVAVVGAGTMGADICYTIAMAGIPVVLRDVSREQLDHARQHIQELFQGRVARNKMSVGDGLSATLVAMPPFAAASILS